jgi:hypothetical protein
MKQVLFDGQIWDVLAETERNEVPTEALPNTHLMGTILHLRNTITLEDTMVYPWDVWGLEEWENLDGTCDESKLPEYLREG